MLWLHDLTDMIVVGHQPFRFEGTNRAKLAEQGLAELRQSVDTIITIPNQNLFNMSNAKTSLMEAFRYVQRQTRAFLCAESILGVLTETSLQPAPRQGWPTTCCSTVSRISRT